MLRRVAINLFRLVQRIGFLSAFAALDIFGVLRFFGCHSD